MDTDTISQGLAILMGIGLAAACGFRVFVPLFVASLAANADINTIGGTNIQQLLGQDFEWLGSTPVTIALGVATAVEIAAYYIPWVDNVLDSIASPAAVIAGTFVTAAVMPDFLGGGATQWFTAMIIGGGTAGAVQTASVVTRGASTATTGGAGNPIISTAELGGSIVTAILAILVPVIAGIVLIVIFFFVIRAILRYFKRRAQAKPVSQATTPQTDG